MPTNLVFFQTALDARCVTSSFPLGKPSVLQLFHVWSEGMGVPQIDRPEKQMGFHISVAQHTHIADQACVSRAAVLVKTSAARSEQTVWMRVFQESDLLIENKEPVCWTDVCERESVSKCLGSEGWMYESLFKPLVYGIYKDQCFK